MPAETIEQVETVEQSADPKKKFPFILIALIVLVLGIPIALVTNNGGGGGGGGNGNGTRPTSNPVLSTLVADPESINTIIFGYKEADKASYINAVNDSKNNNTKIALIKETVKFTIPLSNRKQILYISDIDGGDKGVTIKAKTIKPTGSSSDGTTSILYTAKDDYKIDTLIISQNNEWIAWSENKPPDGEEDIHTKNFFRSFKARIGSSGSVISGTLSPIPLNSEKSDTDVTIHMPDIISDSGQVYFNGIKPTTYFLHDGITNEANKTILPTNSYNSSPYLVNNRFLLYTAFEASNNPKLTAGNTTSARQEVINRNIVRLADLQTAGTNPATSIVAAPGNEGEHYNHPVFVSGDPNSQFRTAVEIHKAVPGENGELKLSLKEIQVVTRLPSGSFQKKTIVTVPSDKKYRILTVGSRPNGNKTLLVGEETSTLGNMGSGWFVASSGYQPMLSKILIFDLDQNTPSLVSEIALSPESSEFLGVLPKSPSETIGIDRNESLGTGRDNSQLQLELFVPVEPKRQRSNPRSECEKEWKEKGYPNLEACDACPIYVYSNLTQNITIKPLTPISSISSLPALNNSSWNFVADKEGNLLFPDQTIYKKIDFLFPRGVVVKPTQGLIIDQNNYAKEIRLYALAQGFNEHELADVVEFLMPQIKNSKYIFLSNLSKEATKQLLDIEVTPKPSVQETRMFYVEKLEELPTEKPQEPVFSPIVRSEFSVVTWGGIIK